MYCGEIHRRTETYTVEDIVYSVNTRGCCKYPERDGTKSWKANSPVLNLLLPILNEREFKNDGKTVKVPLMTAFASSNEFPEDRESLAAIYDRFVLRMNIDGIRDTKNVEKMMADRVVRNNKSSVNPSPTIISIAEIEALHEAAMNVSFHKNVLGVLVKIQNIAQKKGGVFISDRKKNQCIDILQAYALYNGRGHVSVDDMMILKYVFFDEGVPMDEIEAEILKLVDPYTDEINKYYRQFKEIKDKIDAETDPTERLKSIIEADKSMNLVLTNIGNSIKKAQTSGKDVTEFLAKRDEIAQYRGDMINIALGKTITQTNVTQDLSGINFSHTTVSSDNQAVSNNTFDINNVISTLSQDRP